MSSFWNFTFAAILIIVWIVAGGFVTQANTYLGKYKDKDGFLHSAYWLTFWAAFTTWTLVGIFVLLVILSFLGVVALFGSGAGEAGVAAEGSAVAVEEGAVAAEEEAAAVERKAANAERKAVKKSTSKKKTSKTEEGISWLTIGFLIFALILVAITGVLSATAATKMTQSPNFDNTNAKLQKAYTDCIIAASMSLGAGGLLVIGLIIYFIVGESRSRKIKNEKELEAKNRELLLEEKKAQLQQSKQSQLQQIQTAKQQKADLVKLTQEKNALQLQAAALKLEQQKEALATAMAISTA